MRSVVVWRILTYEKWRTALATAGIFIAVVLIFLQLGFYGAVPRGGMLVYDAMRFDIMLTSAEYSIQVRSQTLPRIRLYQALSVSGVASVAPLYQGAVAWHNLDGRTIRRAFLMAFNPRDNVFNVPEIVAQADMLREADTILVERANKPELGPEKIGRIIEMNGRALHIGGTYSFGLGFLGLGAAVTSDQNFVRIFPNQTLSDVSLGLVTLERGAEPDTVAAELRRILPADTRVFTRAELTDHEVSYWVTATSTGLVFGFGAVIAVIVGLVILFQILSTQVTRNLHQYATLKAMGFTDRYLGGIVVYQAAVMALIAFVPALVVAVFTYQSTRASTGLPIYMTSERVVMVLLVTLAMAVGSGLLALRVVKRADPVELF